MEIGKRIKVLRKEAGLSQEGLARRADISLNVMNRIETGTVTDPHFSTLIGIASGLGVPVAELMKEEIDPKDQAPRLPEGLPSEAQRLLEANERFLRAQMDPAMREEFVRANIDFWNEQLDRIVQVEGFQPEQMEVRKVVDSLFEPYRKQRAEQRGSVETGNQR